MTTLPLVTGRELIFSVLSDSSPDPGGQTWPDVIFRKFAKIGSSHGEVSLFSTILTMTESKTTSMKYPDFREIECVKYISNFLPQNLHKDAFKNLMDQVEFNSDEESSIVIYGKKIKIPRKQVGYGDAGTNYKFSGNIVTAKPWTDSEHLLQIKDYLVEKFNYPISFVLLNHYKDGTDYISYHSDDEKDLNGNYPIISLSLGASRPFRFKNKKTAKVYEQTLQDNSLVLMYPPCQSDYTHSLPKTMRVKEPRLNLTFRVMR